MLIIIFLINYFILLIKFVIKGSVFYVFSKSDLPSFNPPIIYEKQNLFNNGTKYGGKYVSNPTHIECDELQKNEFLSGDYINKITCNI